MDGQWGEIVEDIRSVPKVIRRATVSLLWLGFLIAVGGAVAFWLTIPLTALFIVALVVFPVITAVTAVAVTSLLW